MKPGFGAAIGVVIVVMLFIATLLLPNYSRPPIQTTQIGYRGVGMQDGVNLRQKAALIAASLPSRPQLPIVTTGPKARDVYQNVQVLGDLSQSQFTRLMLAITQWVSPQQGCTYCHGAQGFADDTLYTKRVARWMIQMTRHINNDWKPHVGVVGVTCNTCHRGNNVPLNVWFEPEITGVQPGSNAVLGYYKALYGPSAAAGYASLSQDPFGPYLDDSEANSTRIRVNSPEALPTGNRASTKQTEQTYALMMHMATALGVNCTYCHNSRQFASWEQSPPTRTNAWYGIRMVRDVNLNYIAPVTSVFPPYRLGPHGDVSKVNCTTCHQGLAKPLNGVSMIPDYPELAWANTVTREDLLPGTLQPMYEQARATPAAATPATTTPAATTPATTAPAEGAPVPPAPGTPEAVPGATEAAPASDGLAVPGGDVTPVEAAASTEAAAEAPTSAPAPAEPIAPAPPSPAAPASSAAPAPAAAVPAPAAQ